MQPKRGAPAGDDPRLNALLDQLGDDNSAPTRHEIAAALPAGQMVPQLTTKLAARLRCYFESPRHNCERYNLDAVDIDLAGMGLIGIATKGMWNGFVAINVTPLGTHALYRFRHETIANRKPHHQLASRLAAWLRAKGRITWEGIEFEAPVTQRTGCKPDGGGTDTLPEFPYSTHVRPDVFSIEYSLQAHGIKPAVHEVKVSRADFLADLAKPEKREGYAAIAETVYYAAPVGVLTPTDVPDGFGLVVETEQGKFEILKRAKRRKAVRLTPPQYLKLVLRPGCFPDPEAEQ